MKKQIAVICNNYGQSNDGIGAYSKAVYSYNFDLIQVDTFSAICDTNGGAFKKALNMGMTHIILQLVRKLRTGADYEAIIIEYPFAEWNLLIIYALSMLHQIAGKKKVKIIASIHEYRRVNFLRKRIIEYICSISDAIFVTDQDMQQSLGKICNKAFIRDIPTNLYSEDICIENKNNKEFVYFGLVSKTKAFDELLEGWDSFNVDGQYHLSVYSATMLEDVDKHIGVSYFYNATADRILSAMEKSGFCFVPIKPCVDYKNATFKTSCITGCISIGKFDDKFKKLPFVIDMSSYEPGDFVKALKCSRDYDNETIMEMQKKAFEYGKKYIPGNASLKLEDIILKVCMK